MKKAVFEILEECSKLTSQKQKSEYLAANANDTVKKVLMFAYHPGIVWNLPLGTPPYTPCNLPDQETRLYQEARKMENFVNGNRSDLPKLRLESLFIQVLESIHPKDAELLCSVKDKKIPYKGITYNLVQQTFPNILPVKEEK